MVWKSIGCGGDYGRVKALPAERPKSRQNGGLIALIGKVEKRRPSTNYENEWLERLTTLSDDMFLYNQSAGRILMKVAQNNVNFDQYVGLPFTKGITERETGRTELILGSAAHHGEAMQGQYDGALWAPTEKKYGNTLRWICVGTLNQGFIGLDYQVRADVDAGIARNQQDIEFLAQTLLQYGYNENLKLFLLNPPHLQESKEGIKMRGRGLERLVDYAKIKLSLR